MLVMLGCGFSKAMQQKIWIFCTEENDASLLAVDYICCLDICGFNFTIITREGLGDSPCQAQISFSETIRNRRCSLPTLFFCGLQRCFFSSQPASWF